MSNRRRLSCSTGIAIMVYKTIETIGMTKGFKLLHCTLALHRKRNAWKGIAQVCETLKHKKKNVELLAIHVHCTEGGERERNVQATVQANERASERPYKNVNK